MAPAVASESAEPTDCIIEAAQHVRAGATETNRVLDATDPKSRNGRIWHPVAPKLPDN